MMMFVGKNNFPADILWLMKGMFEDEAEDLINFEGRIRLDSGKHNSYTLKISKKWQAAKLDYDNRTKITTSYFVRYK
jgi:hypothetical protein